LETDRNAVLITRAFLRGIIKPETCQINDSSWWARTMPLVQAMASLDELDLLKVLHNHQCALISNSSLEKDSFKSVQTQARDLFQDMINIMRPWQTKDSSTVNKQTLVEAFTQEFGDPNDPAVVAKYKAAADKQREELMQTKQAGVDAAQQVQELERRLTQKIPKPRGKA
jgi:hypothetical protein